MRLPTAVTRIRLHVFIAQSVLSGLILSTPAIAQGGHGPVFGLATPTLPLGAWNLDLTLMSVEVGNRASAVRGTIRYGWTPDIQLNFSVPVALDTIAQSPNTRVGTMMGGMGDVEAMIIWRVHKQYPGVGKRFETTLLVSALYPVLDPRRGVDVGPGFHVAAVTGYVSRTVYAWGGAGYQRYLEASSDRLGDLAYLSAVVAWRPQVFQGDYPKPDCRIFIESVVEFAGRDQIAGTEVPNSGGQKVFVGPTFLGLYQAFGLGSDVLFPVYQNLNGIQLEEGIRFALNLSYWF